MEEGEEAQGGHVLAVALGSGELVLLRGHDDVSPARVATGLRGDTLQMEWGNSRELLAVAGTLVPEGNESGDNPPYRNVVKFYSDTGALIYTIVVPYTQARVSALTWGHSARRLFVACGGAVATARVYRMVAPLQLLARVRAAQFLPSQRAAASLPLPPSLQPLLVKYFRHTIRCNVPSPESVRQFVSRPPAPPARAYCTMLRHDDDETAAFTLYLEHLGGLIPILKGRRTSKIRPEFVIFDPQGEESESISSAERESSSSSSSSGGSSGVVQGSPRRVASPQPSDTSDSDREEGCSGSPRLQRRRRARERRKYEKIRHTTEKDEALDELTYIDSLPEEVRLVEVTSNIWGTKFKIHGLAKDVPANLGQVTYKTSLLHLQPRQMTLMITDLSEDEPIGPDPNFNPNIFSEDEEDVFQLNDDNKSPSHANNNNRRNERINIINNSMAQNEHLSSINNNNNNVNNNASLARAESYDEFPFIDTNDSSNHVTESVYSTPVRHTSQERRMTNTSGVTNRHAISPLRCDGSVPTLQSPKNAVAPTDIIFERPSPQTLACGGRGDFCGGRTEYNVRSDNVTLKGNLEQTFNLNLSLEPARQVTIKKSDSHVTDNCLSKLRKNICGRGESTTYETSSRVMKTINKNYEYEILPDTLAKRIDSLKNSQRTEDLKFIDEETPVETNINNLTDRPKERPQRAAVPISPVCGNVPVYAAMTRSCSVGYLDMVDPAAVSLAALREPPRRLVLVPDPRKNRRREYKSKPPAVDTLKSPNLNKCGKSRSLDSSELSLSCDQKEGASKEAENKKEVKLERNENSVRRKRVENPSCPTCLVVLRRPESGVCHTCNAPPAPPIQPPKEADYTKYYSSLEQLALRLLASRGRSRANINNNTAEDAISRESNSAPASPRPARSQPASPAPVHRPRRQRYSSSSPIRQLLNSPLLNRRRHKRLSESSDEESSNGYAETINNRDYRNLESFQKAQLRNKLKRVSGVTSATSNIPSGNAGRRQLMMHNKAPIWNETSQVYQLDFGGRVTQESAKNFQIEYLGRQVMQFGRIDGNAYTLDFQYPFSALQAFSVALANVTQRLK